jgi:MoxR-like ATPase
VVQQTTSTRKAAIDALFTGRDVLQFHELVRKVPVAEEVVRFGVRLVTATRPNQPGTPDFVNEWVNWGAGTRAGQFLVLGAKVRVLLEGRTHVTKDDIRALARPVLRHRVLLNYRAEAEGVTVEKLIARVLEAVT